MPKIIFIIDQDKEVEIEAQEGLSVLEIAHQNNIDLEGACEGSLACSTCHVIVEEKGFFDRLPKAEEAEEDMLDLAFGLTQTSRLGCQLIVSKDIDGIKFRLPIATRNL